MRKAIKNAKAEQPSFKLISSGDFNATIGRDSYGNYAGVGQNNDHWPTITNGHNLLKLADALDLQISDTRFRTKNINRATYIAPGDRFSQRLVYFLVDNKCRKICTSLQSLPWSTWRQSRIRHRPPLTSTKTGFPYQKKPQNPSKPQETGAKIEAKY